MAPIMPRAMRVGLGAAIVALLLTALSSCEFIPLSLISRPVVGTGLETAAEGRDIVAFGDFASVDGLPLGGIVRLNGDGSVDRAFQVATDLGVAAVAPVMMGDRPALVIGGPFTTVHGEPRMAVAAVDAQTGELITTFTPSLSRAATEPLVYSVLPVPERNSVLVGGIFDGVTGHASPGVVELSLADGSVVSGFSSELAPTPASTEVSVRVLAPGLGETGDWSVAVGGDFVAFVDPTGGSHAIALLNSAGAVAAHAPGITDPGASITEIRPDRFRRVYRVTGDIGSATTPSNERILVLDLFVDPALAPAGAPAAAFAIDPGGARVTVGTLSYPFVNSITDDGAGSLIVTARDDLIRDANGNALAVVAALDADGRPDITRSVYAAPGAGVPDPFGFRVRRSGEWTYLGGTFATLTDRASTSVTTDLARFDREYRLDGSFGPQFAGTTTDPAGEPLVYNMIFLPPGF